MAKKKTKKRIKSKKVTSKKKKIKKIRGKACLPAGRGQGAKKQGEKLIGNIEHFFGKISVAAFKLKSPLSVGDIIHIKGPHTDFSQKVESMQIEHQTVQKAKKGEDIGIKVKEKCRVTDSAYLAAKNQEITEKSAKPIAVQKPIFPTAMLNKPKPAAQQARKPTLRPTSQQPSKPASKKPKKTSPYTNTKFLKF